MSQEKSRIGWMIAGFIFLAVVVVGAVAVFYATSNVDRYRPLLEQKLTEALGNPVRLSGIGMVWSGGIAAEARDLMVSENGKTVLSVRRAAMKFDPWALMSRRLVIRSVEVVEPHIELTRGADGGIEVRGVRTKSENNTTSAASAAKSTKPAGAGMDGWSLLIERIQIREGTVEFADTSAMPIRSTVVRHIDADIRDVSLTGPVTLKAKAAVFADRQDLDVSLKVSDFMAGRPKLENVEVKFDLGSIDPAQLKQFAPESAAIEGPLAGQLALKAPQMSLGGVGGAAPDFSAAQEELKNGAVQAALEKILKPDATGKTSLEGAVRVGFDGTAAGLDAPSIERTLTGKLTLDFPRGLLLNVNIVREVLGKLGTMFPGLIDQVSANLPESYRSKLTEQSTILKPFHHEFQIHQGVVQIRGLQVATDFFSAVIDGDLALTGTFDGRGTIQLDATFSKALTQGMPVFSTLANAASQIQLPLLVHYHENQLSVLPDLDFIGQRLLPQAGQILSQFLGAISKNKSQ